MIPTFDGFQILADDVRLRVERLAGVLREQDRNSDADSLAVQAGIFIGCLSRIDSRETPSPALSAAGR